MPADEQSVQMAATDDAVNYYRETADGSSGFNAREIAGEGLSVRLSDLYWLTQQLTATKKSGQQNS